MATKKQNAGKAIVAFAASEHTYGEGDEASVLVVGQRLDLTGGEFKNFPKGVLEEGVYVKMKEGVEGGRYSLKPRENTWLAPWVYEAWRDAGICEPTDDDPTIAATLKASEEEARRAIVDRDTAKLEREVAVSERESAVESCNELTLERDDLLSRCDMVAVELDAASSERDAEKLRAAEAVLQLHAARDQAEKVHGLLQPDPKSGVELCDTAKAVLAEFEVLLEMLPSAMPEVSAEGAGKEPEQAQD